LLRIFSGSPHSCGWRGSIFVRKKIDSFTLQIEITQMTSLVIVESPAKCKKIQGFLGPGWNVIASMGHIRALEESLSAIGLDTDFEPKYQFLKEKAKAISQLKDAASKAKTVYLASDDDREGEAIAYSVALLLRLSPETTPRSVFHEITERAVKSAIENPRYIDMNRVNAQQARSILDMMVGFTISPLLWNYIGPGLSAGRCQTPALRILADREHEIQSFSSQTVWKVKGQWQTQSNFPLDSQLVDELEDQESALNYLENIHADAGGTVLRANTKQWQESPPKPLITSTLQQEASALFSSNPKKTMFSAQKLYEAGYITYMRTDHAILSEEARGEAQELVKKLCGDAYVQKEEAKAKPKSKTQTTPQAQEAHEAIRPTHFTTQELPSNEGWEAIDTKLYKLIWNRAMQSVMTPAKGDERTITFVAQGDPGEFPWEAKWKRTTFLGWRKIGQAAVNLDATDDTGESETATATWIQAVNIKEGDTVSWKTLEAHPQVSKPPPRFTEATLVRELEKKGIGRPSTYASLVATLFDKKYAEKKDKPAQQVSFQHFLLATLGQWPPKQESKSKTLGAEKEKLSPTPLGLSCVQFCVKEFPQLFAYDFTSHMEHRLDAIAHGNEPWKQICRDVWNSYNQKLETLKKEKTNKASSPRLHDFGNGLKAVLGKKGPVILQEANGETVFYGWPDGVAFGDMTADKAQAFLQTKTQPTSWGDYEGTPMIAKKGPFGSYIEWGTVRVPLLIGDTVESIQEKLSAKKNSALHTIGNLEFRKGPYGVYMFKKVANGKKPTFVGLPEGLDPTQLTPEAAERIYQTGLQQRSSGSGSARGGSRGGRGRGRGGRGGKSHASPEG
jgi:DNA topoisomerase I